MTEDVQKLTAILLEVLDELAPLQPPATERALRRRMEEIAQLGVIYECCSDKCPWRGLRSDTVHPKHNPDRLLCPLCYEVVEAV